MLKQDITNEGADGPMVSATPTRALLSAGILAGPLFIIASLVQVLARQGFDLQRQPISMLSLGDLGWIQIANFELTALLVLAGAVGIRRALRGGRAGTWGPLLLGGYGLGLVAAGIFHPPWRYRRMGILRSRPRITNHC